MASPMAADRDDGDAGQRATRWVGRSVPRVEDAALLTGRGRYIDDLGVRPGTLQTAILRSPHAHAEIEAIDCQAARAADGVFAVLTGADIVALTSSLVVGIKAPIDCWPIATDRVRYVGEPVAIVVASDRYRAEDALDLIEVRYRQLPAIVDPLAAAAPDAPLLHPRAQSNVVGERVFRYGDPEGAFAAAAHRVRVDVRYPRNSCTPIETYGVVAEYDAAEDAYDVLANFQGPFSLHPVMARALKVPGNRLRLRTPPDSGGSFGVKQAIFPYIVLIAAAARATGRPVKWIEDRLEHLCGSVSATNRVTTLEAAVGERRPHRRARLGPARRLRCAPARAGAGHALPHARQSDRRLRHPPRQGAQPHRAHQQDPDRAQPRLRRAANVLPAGAADAADRDRAETRSA